MSEVALILGRNRFLCYHAVASLGMRGIKSDVISLPKFSHVRFSKYCRNFISLPNNFDFMEAHEKLELLKDVLHKKYLTIFPVDLPSIELINSARDTIRSPIFPVPKESTLKLLKSKILFSDFLRRSSIPLPRTQILNHQTYAQALRELRFPVVIKPDSGQGGEGVRKFNLYSEAKFFLDTFPSDYFPLIAQEFVEGDLIGLNLLSVEGNVLAWTIQSQGFPGSKYTLFFNEEVLKAGRSICRQLNFNGVANFDIIYNPKTKEFKFLECNPRLWASTMVSTWMGVNFPYLGVMAAINDFRPSLFEPVSGEISYARNLRIKNFVRNLLMGHPYTPSGFNENSLFAYRGMLSDIKPHIMSPMIKAPMGPKHKYFPLKGHPDRLQSSPFCPELTPGSPLY